MQSKRVTFRSGFTLIELILVLGIIACIVGIVAPTLRGFSAGSRLRDSADHFLTLTRLARVQALSTGQVHRVTVDKQNNRCYVAAEDGQELREIEKGMDGNFEIPDGISFELVNTPNQGGQGHVDNNGNNYVQFFSNGRTQAMKWKVLLADGQSFLEIECVAPTEGFALVTSGGAR